MPNESIELPESYQKARKVFIFVSALLFAWELVGININSFESEGINIAFDSPEALPIVLVLATLYFWIRLTFEWNFLSIEIRKFPYTKIDYFLSNFLGFMALFIFAYQEYFGNQVYNILSNNPSLFSITALYIFLMLFIAPDVRKAVSEGRVRPSYFLIYSTVLYLILIIFLNDYHYIAWIYGGLTSAYLLLSIVYLNIKIKKKKKDI